MLWLISGANYDLTILLYRRLRRLFHLFTVQNFKGGVMDTLTRKDPSIQDVLEKHCYNCSSFESGKSCSCSAGQHEAWTPRQGGETSTYKKEDFSHCGMEGMTTSSNPLYFLDKIISVLTEMNKKLDEILKEGKMKLLIIIILCLIPVLGFPCTGNDGSTGGDTPSGDTGPSDSGSSSDSSGDNSDQYEYCHWEQYQNDKYCIRRNHDNQL